MYAIHPFITTPPDCQIIWRYLRLEHFRDMVERDQLHFSGFDQFTDKHEGSLPLENYRRRAEGIRTPSENEFPDVNHLLSAPLTEDWRNRCYASCWFMGEHENALMWQCYAAQGKGVAVKSTIERMKAAFSDDYPPYVFIGEVQYLDFQTGYIPRTNSMNPIFRKRKEFSQENEVRAVCIDNEDMKPSWKIESGVFIPCRMEVLVEEVRVSHLNIDSIEVITGLSVGKPWKVVPSDLGGNPLF